MNIQKKGFTLIEILIAAAMIGTALITLLSSINYSLKIMNKSRYKKYAVIAADMIFQQISVSDNPETFKTKGELEFEKIKYEWEKRIVKRDISKLLEIYGVKPENKGSDEKMDFKVKELVITVNYKFYNEKEKMVFKKVIL